MLTRSNLPYLVLPLALVTIAGLLSVCANGADFRDVKGEPGLSYKNDRIREETWSIHVLRMDRARKDLCLYSAHAKGKVLAVSMLAEQARAVPSEFGRALAAINGDFYVRDTPGFAGDPRGLQIINGELISAPDTACVWIDAEGNPHLDQVKGDFTVTWPDNSKVAFGLNQQRLQGKAVLYTPTYGPATRTTGRDIILEKDGDGPWLPLQANQIYHARVREIRTNGNTQLVPNVMVLSMIPPMLAGRSELVPGSILNISTATAPEMKGVKAAIGGGPALIEGGKASITATSPPRGTSGDYTQRSRYEEHPRAAVGWSPTHIYLVVVDGRQPNLSVGIKLADLARYMIGLGCTEAMNLDGGKSAQMWLDGRIVNSPCQGEDTVANSLLVVRRP